MSCEDHLGNEDITGNEDGGQLQDEAKAEAASFRSGSWSAQPSATA